MIMKTDQNTAAGRVIFIEAPRHQDIASAMTFGPRLDLYDSAHGPRQRAPRPSVMDFEAFTANLLNRLDDVGYDPSVDWVVASGSQLMLCLAWAALAVTHKRFKALVYHAATSQYIERTYDASWPASHGSTSA